MVKFMSIGLADTHNLHDLHKPVILILLCGYSSCKLRGTVFSSTMCHGKICDLYTLSLADHELLLPGARGRREG